MTDKKEAKVEIESALRCLNKVKKKLTPNEYTDLHNFLLNTRDAIDGDYVHWRFKKHKTKD